MTSSALSSNSNNVVVGAAAAAAKKSPFVQGSMTGLAVANSLGSAPYSSTSYLHQRSASKNSFVAPTTSSIGTNMIDNPLSASPMASMTMQNMTYSPSIAQDNTSNDSNVNANTNNTNAFPAATQTFPATSLTSPFMLPMQQTTAIHTPKNSAATVATVGSNTYKMNGIDGNNSNNTSAKTTRRIFQQDDNTSASPGYGANTNSRSLGTHFVTNEQMSIPMGITSLHSSASNQNYGRNDDTLANTNFACTDDHTLSPPPQGVLFGVSPSASAIATTTQALNYTQANGTCNVQPQQE
uniref:Uncharacterized protein n=1 Tax=Lygus hesperus TaxID=30085 RepID=A0A146KZZ0_LYGHE